MVTFLKNELRKFRKVLGPQDPECLEKLREDEVVGGEEEEQRSSNRDEFLKITLNFLRNMNQDQLADSLQSSKMLFRMTYCFWKYGVYLLEL